MSKENYILLTTLCQRYKVEMTFFDELKDHGLIEIITIKEAFYIALEHIKNLEKILRLHQDLEINIAGIDTIFNLLDQLQALKKEKLMLENKLKIYEDF